MAKSIDQILTERPVDRAAVDEHKARMLEEIDEVLAEPNVEPWQSDKHAAGRGEPDKW